MIYTAFCSQACKEAFSCLQLSINFGLIPEVINFEVYLMKFQKMLFTGGTAAWLSQIGTLAESRLFFLSYVCQSCLLALCFSPFVLCHYCFSRSLQRKIPKPAESSLSRQGLFCGWLHLHIHQHIPCCHLPTLFIPVPLHKAPVGIWWLKCKAIHPLLDSCRLSTSDDAQGKGL